MQFHRITLRNIRNLEDAGIEPGAGFNYFVGENGSGKTSLLEGIHVLSTGSSFRTRKPVNLIRHEQASLQSFAEFTYRSDLRPHTVGVERARNGSTRVKIDRESTYSLTDLTQTIPLLALHPESHNLVNGGPTQRRKLIDWGVFHVEPGFVSVWREFRRALDQRNAALKHGASDEAVIVWNRVLAEAGESLHKHRVDYLSDLLPFMSQLLERAGWGSSVSLSIRRGWNEELSLSEELAKSLKRDRVHRNTVSGPHRAELVLNFNNEEIRHMFSRGQQKLFIYLLKIAQANHLFRVRNIRSVFLCDDMPSELDKKNRARISQALLDSGYQVFATSVVMLEEEFDSLQSRVFHVEHGKVHQVV
jgi:DNA replication and repair protein RecF